MIQLSLILMYARVIYKSLNASWIGWFIDISHLVCSHNFFLFSLFFIVTLHSKLCWLALKRHEKDWKNVFLTNYVYTCSQYVSKLYKLQNFCNSFTHISACIIVTKRVMRHRRSWETPKPVRSSNSGKSFSTHRNLQFMAILKWSFKLKGKSRFITKPFAFRSTFSPLSK